MTCLGPYEMFFLTLCFIVTKFSVLAYLIIWMHTNNIYLFLQSPYEMFFPPQKFCVVYLNFTGYQTYCFAR